MKNKLLKIGLLLCMVNSSYAENIKVQLLKDISLKEKSGETKALILFEDKAKENFILTGEFKNKQMLSGKTSIEVLWEKVKKGKATVDLSKKFSSKLLTKEDIKSQNEFKASGDLKSLEENMNSLLLKSDSKIEDKEDKKLLAKINNEDSLDDDKKTTSSGTTGDIFGKNSTATNSSIPAQNTSSTNIPSSGFTDTEKGDVASVNPISDESLEDKSTNSATEEEITECPKIVSGDSVQFRHVVNNKCENNGSPVPILEVSEGCTPKIDFNKKTVQMSTQKVASLDGETSTIENCSLKNETIALKSTFNGCESIFRKDKVAKVQQEQYYYTYNNEDVKVGSCVDSMTMFPVSTFVETNKMCAPLIDFDGRKVQFAYRTVANVDESQVELEPCRYDTEQHELYTTYDGAEIVNDFINGKSVQYERFYYIFENKNIYVGEARPSSLEWAHYLTSQTCEPQRVDDAVIYNQRVAYKDNKGIINYITECKPYSNNQLKISKEFGGYEHDFVNHQSYPRTREYFLHPDTNAKVYLNDFTKEAINFPHKTEHVRWENDDEKLYSTEYVKSYFVDTVYAKGNIYTDGSIEGNPTALAPVPYVKALESAEFVRSLGIQRLNKVGDKYTYYSDTTKVIDHGNGLFPVDKSATVNITNLSKLISVVGWSGYLKCGSDSGSHSVNYNSCANGDTVNSTKSYQYIQNIDTNSGDGYSCGTSQKTMSYTHKDCVKWKYYEEIGEYNFITSYLRPDTTTFKQNTKTLLRVIK
jgi:hypothetical protein